MATKNLQTLAVRNASSVRVTGMGCTGSMQADGKFQAHFLSLLWYPLSGEQPAAHAARLAKPGPFAIRTGPESFLAEDNARAAEAVLRTGRSAVRGVVSPRSTASAYAALAKRG